MSNYQQLLLFNTNQILSIHLSSMKNISEMISSIIFDSSFNCLESLMFYTIESNLLISILPTLTCLFLINN